MTVKPTIIARNEIARTRLFRVEELSLEFSNGQKRTYERMVSGSAGAVMIVPITARDELVMIREYSAGTDNYQLAFPKGLMEKGETVFEAADREIKEEIGFGAKQFATLKKVSLAPGYFTHQMEIVVAESLYAEKLAGDEPEPLEIVYWPICDIDQLIDQPDFTEARSIAALFLLERYLRGRE